MWDKKNTGAFFYSLRKIYILGAIIIPLSIPALASAASYTWRVTSGDWSDAANWGGTEPTSSDYVFIDNGGTATITKTDEYCVFLSPGFTSKSSGTVRMDNGYLTTLNEDIGHSGMGTFIQNGGTNSITSKLTIGAISGSSGTYNLSDTGELYTDYECIGSSGIGTFTQTGGIHTVSNNINLGGSSGTYNLSGGQLSASPEFIGYQGTGTFTQTGGTNTVSYLSLGFYNGDRGTYNLSGGKLILKSLSKGSGIAVFNFGGGTLQVEENLICSLPMTLTGDGGNANIDTAGITVTMSGILSGDGGLNKLGSGTLTLGGSNSYKGNTLIKAGTLKLTSSGSIGSSPIIDVMSGSVLDMGGSISFGLGGTQTLAGGGKVEGSVTAAAGSHISPGDSAAGTLAIMYDLTLSDGAHLDFELDYPPFYSDKITCSNLHLNGLDFNDFTFTALARFGKGTYILIDAGKISGSLGSNLTGNIGNYSGRLFLSGSDLMLTVVPEPGAGLLLATACLSFMSYWQTRKNH